MKQQEKKRQLEQERLAELHAEKTLQLQKKREREDQELEVLRAQNKSREAEAA